VDAGSFFHDGQEVDVGQTGNVFFLGNAAEKIEGCQLMGDIFFEAFLDFFNGLIWLLNHIFESLWLDYNNVWRGTKHNISENLPEANTMTAARQI
jgi:hypothetical protein